MRLSILALIAGIVIISTPAEVSAQTSGLVAHWTLDTQNVDAAQATAEVRDVRGFNNHADLRNRAATTVVGKIGQAIQFDVLTIMQRRFPSQVFLTQPRLFISLPIVVNKML